MDCIFCKIIKGEMPANILYEDEKVIVILDAYPNCDGHTLIIPKKHIVDFKDLDDETLLHINKLAKSFTDFLMKHLNKDAITISVNYGSMQIVKHYHMHIMPNLKDKIKLSVDEVYEILSKV